MNLRWKRLDRWQNVVLIAVYMALPIAGLIAILYAKYVAKMPDL